MLPAWRILCDNHRVLQGIDYDLDGTTAWCFRRCALANVPSTPPFGAAPKCRTPHGRIWIGNGQTGGATPMVSGVWAVLWRGRDGDPCRVIRFIDTCVQDHTHFCGATAPNAAAARTKEMGPSPLMRCNRCKRPCFATARVVPIAIPRQPPVTLLTFLCHAPLCFDARGPNGKRNHDEIPVLGSTILAGTFGPHRQTNALSLLGIDP